MEDESFRSMLKFFRPGYEPCGRKALTENYLTKLYSATRDLIHLAKLSTLVSQLMHGHRAQVNHTGINIKDWLQEILQEWKIKIPNVACTTTDNGEDIRLAIDLLKMPHVRCIGHTLQN